MSNKDKYEFAYDSPFGGEPHVSFVSASDGWKAVAVPNKDSLYNLHHQEKDVSMTVELALVHRLVHESWKSYDGFAVDWGNKQAYGHAWTKVGVATSKIGNPPPEETAAIAVL